MRLRYYGPRILLILCVLTIAIVIIMDHSHHQHHHHDHNMMTTTSADHQDHSIAHDRHNHFSHSGHQNAKHHSIEHHPMYFNFNWRGTVLFESFTLDAKTGIFCLILMTIVIGVLYEAVKYLRQYIHRDIAITEPAEPETSDTTRLLADTYEQIRYSIRSREHLLQTLLYVVQMVCSYILMLVVMTYNVWVVVTMLVALGGGFFVCGWKVHQLGSLDIEASCQNECHTSPLKQELGRSEFRESELEPLREGMETNLDLDTNNTRETKI
ncbi:high affinity copper uptake protein 1-like isoform X1 [Pecten maximus]|uniref:high affinity copper uptake protein 1-like isoform X1 n=2 Tax=Pecten maximus TaxID=6579 RepID=UPI0014584647|nr:high affinity copper uptake protein 1-like isoform X1 [Pecten maximus]